MTSYRAYTDSSTGQIVVINLDTGETRTAEQGTPITEITPEAFRGYVEGGQAQPTPPTPSQEWGQLPSGQTQTGYTTPSQPTPTPPQPVSEPTPKKPTEVEKAVSEKSISQVAKPTGHMYTYTYAYPYTVETIKEYEERKKWEGFGKETGITPQEYAQSQRSVFEEVERRTVEARSTTRSDLASWWRERIVGVGTGFGRHAEAVFKPATWKTVGTMVKKPEYFGMAVGGLAITTAQEAQEHPLEFAAETGIALVATGAIGKGFGKVKTKFIEPKPTVHVDVGRVAVKGKVGITETKFLMKAGKEKYVGTSKTRFTLPSEQKEPSVGVSLIKMKDVRKGTVERVVGISKVKELKEVGDMRVSVGLGKTAGVTPELKVKLKPIKSGGLFLAEEGEITKIYSGVLTERGKEIGIAALRKAEQRPGAYKFYPTPVEDLAKIHTETILKPRAVAVKPPRPIMKVSVRPSYTAGGLEYVAKKMIPITEEYEYIAYPKGMEIPMPKEKLEVSPRVVRATASVFRTRMMPRQELKPIQKFIPSERQVPVQKPIEIQIQKPIQRQLQIQRQKQKQILRTELMAPVVPMIPPSPKTPITPSFTLRIPKGFKKPVLERGRLTVPKRRTKYRPDIAAIMLKQFGKPPKKGKMMTGLERRFLVRRKRTRRKRR